MTALETQVGQIYINNRKLSKSFVSLFSEKIPETNAEIFALMEVPLLNPAAWIEYERLLKSMFNILRRNFKKSNPNAFENSIAQINDFLEKSAEELHTSWTGRMNACLAVRLGENLSIASTGKVHAYLLREQQFSDIADSRINEDSQKIFENFAIGKVKKNDFLVLSTAQLFNYISLIRLKEILNDLPLAAACQTAAELSHDLADQSVSFAAFIIEFGFIEEFSNQTLNKLMNITEQASILEKAKIPINALKKFVSHTMLITKQVRIPKINIKNINASALKTYAKEYTDLNKLRELPKAKKFFLATAALFIILFIVNIPVAVSFRQKSLEQKQFEQKLTEIQNKINSANLANVSSDTARANQLTRQASEQLGSIPENKAFATKKKELSKQINDLTESINRVRNISAEELFAYSGANLNEITILENNLYVWDKDNAILISYDSKQKKVGDEFKVNTGPIAQLTAINGYFILASKNGDIYRMEASKKIPIKQPLSLGSGNHGLAAFGPPIRLYTIKSAENKILSGIISSKAPANYLKDNSDISKALDLVIDKTDNNIYVLSENKIQKFAAGKSKPFKDPELSFSAGSKIFAGKNNLYIMDPGIKRLILIDKKRGSIISQFASSRFKNLKGFAIDEANKKAYLLNEQSVLVIHL